MEEVGAEEKKPAGQEEAKEEAASAAAVPAAAAAAATTTVPAAAAAAAAVPAAAAAAAAELHSSKKPPVPVYGGMKNLDLTSNGYKAFPPVTESDVPSGFNEFNIPGPEVTDLQVESFDFEGIGDAPAPAAQAPAAQAPAAQAPAAVPRPQPPPRVPSQRKRNNAAVVVVKTEPEVKAEAGVKKARREQPGYIQASTQFAALNVGFEVASGAPPLDSRKTLLSEVTAEYTLNSNPPVVASTHIFVGAQINFTTKRLCSYNVDTALAYGVLAIQTSAPTLTLTRDP